MRYPCGRGGITAAHRQTHRARGNRHRDDDDLDDRRHVHGRTAIGIPPHRPGDHLQPPPLLRGNIGSRQEHIPIRTRCAKLSQFVLPRIRDAFRRWGQFSGRLERVGRERRGLESIERCHGRGQRHDVRTRLRNEAETRTRARTNAEEKNNATTQSSRGRSHRSHHDIRSNDGISNRRSARPSQNNHSTSLRAGVRSRLHRIFENHGLGVFDLGKCPVFGRGRHRGGNGIANTVANIIANSFADFRIPLHLGSRFFPSHDSAIVPANHAAASAPRHLLPDTHRDDDTSPHIHRSHHRPQSHNTPTDVHHPTPRHPTPHVRPPRIRTIRHHPRLPLVRRKPRRTLAIARTARPRSLPQPPSLRRRSMDGDGTIQRLRTVPIPRGGGGGVLFGVLSTDAGVRVHREECGRGGERVG
mmetsp:Transcript_11935/g.22332  ORF Transcript_11935/g.22332 Transcript_11935/m.22332 type:complete len:414 (-) Transcript_11935:313-1554(-)